MTIYKRLEKAERHHAGKLKSLYFTKGELRLNTDNKYAVELRSSAVWFGEEPIEETFSEVFDTWEQAVEYCRQIEAGELPEIFRAVILTDYTTEPCCHYSFSD